MIGQGPGRKTGALFFPTPSQLRRRRPAPIASGHAIDLLFMIILNAKPRAQCRTMINDSVLLRRFIRSERD
jgi:hypothetical protein